jgi:hypothetical protein
MRREEALTAVRRKIEEGLASLARGERVDGATLLAELERALDRREKPTDR